MGAKRSDGQTRPDRSITFHPDGTIPLRLAAGERASVLATEEGIIEAAFAQPGAGART